MKRRILNTFVNIIVLVASSVAFGAGAVRFPEGNVTLENGYLDMSPAGKGVIFPDGTIQSTSANGVPGPQGNPGTSPFSLNGADTTYTAGSVGIGTTQPHASALFEVASTTKGFLAPRMTADELNAIVNPAVGLLVYQTNGAAGFYYFNGLFWSGPVVSFDSYGILPLTNGGTGSNDGSITGSGPLSLTAGGANSNITLAPSGTGTVDVSSKRLTSVAVPVAGTDAATRDFVDTASAAAASYVNSEIAAVRLGRTTQQIATLAWYATPSGIEYSAGSSPTGIAFDGANIWVTNFISSGTVTKLNAATGAIVGNYSVMPFPTRIAFDGTSVWVASKNSRFVTKLNVSDGSLVGSYDVGGNVYGGLVFDGVNMWVSTLSSVVKLLASSGVSLGTYAVSSTSGAFDGTNIWLQLFAAPNATSGSVKILKASDGTPVGNPIGTGVPAMDSNGIAFDGSSIWITNTGYNGKTIGKLRAFNLNATYFMGESLGAYNLASIGTPSGVAFDGANIWVAVTSPSTNSGTVVKLRASDVTLVRTYSVGNNPSSIAFDGNYIWVTNSGSNSVTKILAGN